MIDDAGIAMMKHVRRLPRPLVPPKAYLHVPSHANIEFPRNLATFGTCIYVCDMSYIRNVYTYVRLENRRKCTNEFGGYKIHLPWCWKQHCSGTSSWIELCLTPEIIWVVLRLFGSYRNTFRCIKFLSHITKLPT